MIVVVVFVATAVPTAAATADVTAAVATTNAATDTVATAAAAVATTVMDGGLLPDLCMCAAVQVRRSPHAHKEPKSYWGLPERSF